MRLPDFYFRLKTILARFGLYPARNERPGHKEDVPDGFSLFRNCRILVEDSRIHPYIKQSIVTGYYEDKEIDIVLRNIISTDRVLELGASLGVMSTVTCKTSLPRAYTAIEANKDLIEIIRRNHAENNVKCEILNAAASRTQGSSEFYVHSQCWASSLTPFANPLRVDTIPTFPLETLLEKTGANFLICDIEGGEYAVFEACPNLSQVDKICLELHPNSMEKMSALYEYFLHQGFICDKEPPSQPVQYVYFFQMPK